VGPADGDGGPLLKAVGVATTVKALERSLFYAHKDANDHDAGVWTGATAWW